MKSPPTVEELRDLIKVVIKQYPLGTDIDQGCDGLARAVLARVRESVVHLEKCDRGRITIAKVNQHYRNEGPSECRTLGGACAWEDTR